MIKLIKQNNKQITKSPENLSDSLVKLVFQTLFSDEKNEGAMKIKIGRRLELDGDHKNQQNGKNGQSKNTIMYSNYIKK